MAGTLSSRYFPPSIGHLVNVRPGADLLVIAPSQFGAAAPLLAVIGLFSSLVRSVIARRTTILRHRTASAVRICCHRRFEFFKTLTATTPATA